MRDIAQKVLCLSLNAAWQPIGYRTVADAFMLLAKGNGIGLDITFPKQDDGYDFDSPQYDTVKWDKWVELPVYSYHLGIKTIHGEIRVPTVVIAVLYNKMPIKKQRPTKQAIWIRDGSKCQYSDKVLTKREGTIDHVVPQDRGGRETWENLVLCHRDINFRKGNKTNKEAGLKLVRKPFAPKPIPVSHTLREIKCRDWAPFLPHLTERE